MPTWAWYYPPWEGMRKVSQGSWLFPQVYGLPPGPDLHAFPSRVCHHSPAECGQRYFSGCHHPPPSVVLPSFPTASSVVCSQDVSITQATSLFPKITCFPKITVCAGVCLLVLLSKINTALLPPEASRGLQGQEKSRGFMSQLVPGHHS